MRAGLYFNWTALEKGVPWGPVGARAWGQANNNLWPATASPCYSPPVILKMTAGRSPSLYSVRAGGQRLEQGRQGAGGGKASTFRGGWGGQYNRGGGGSKKIRVWGMRGTYIYEGHEGSGGCSRCMRVQGCEE